MAETYEADKSGAPPCGLYLRIPENPDMEVWQPRMLAMRSGVIHSSEYDKNMHIVECALSDKPGRDALEKAAAFVHMAQISGFVALINGPLEFVEMLEADGVLCANTDQLTAAKEALKDDHIIGLACNGREDLDIAKAQDADYITLGQSNIPADPQTLARWSTQSDKLCAVLGSITNDTAGQYVQFGATFIDITYYIGTEDKGPLQAVINMLYAIDLALERAPH